MKAKKGPATQTEIMFEALCHAHNALMDYVDRLERQGGSMHYGRAVIRDVEAAIALTIQVAKREEGKR